MVIAWTCPRARPRRLDADPHHGPAKRLAKETKLQGPPMAFCVIGKAYPPADSERVDAAGGTRSSPLAWQRAEALQTGVSAASTPENLLRAETRARTKSTPALVRRRRSRTTANQVRCWRGDRPVIPDHPHGTGQAGTRPARKTKTESMLMDSYENPGALAAALRHRTNATKNLEILGPPQLWGCSSSRDVCRKLAVGPGSCCGEKGDRSGRRHSCRRQRPDDFALGVVDRVPPLSARCGSAIPESRRDAFDDYLGCAGLMEQSCDSRGRVFGCCVWDGTLGRVGGAWRSSPDQRATVLKSAGRWRTCRASGDPHSASPPRSRRKKNFFWAGFLYRGSVGVSSRGSRSAPYCS